MFNSLIYMYSASCEALWRSNISSEYSSSDNLSEPVNAITSLSYTLFGILGLFLRHYSVFYYTLMFLFILNGVASCLHHYYYSDADWAYASDIIVMNSLASFSVFYILCDNEYYKYSTNSKVLDYLITFIYILLNFTSILLYLISLISYKIDYSWRVFFKIMISLVVASQLFICCFNKNKFIIKSTIWNGILFSIGVAMLYIDNTCQRWMWYNNFNCHSLWHVLVSWSLFGAINVTNISNYTYQGYSIECKPLIKWFPWFLYIVNVKVNEHQYITQGTQVNNFTSEGDSLLRGHRRSKSDGIKLRGF